MVAEKKKKNKKKKKTKQIHHLIKMQDFGQRKPMLFFKI